MLTASITAAQIRLQIDVGFGDAVTPAATLVELPALLDFPVPQLLAYPRETVVAEKLEAFEQLGLANTRMKDFYDVVALSRLFAFEGDLLVNAVVIGPVLLRELSSRPAAVNPTGPRRLVLGPHPQNALEGR